MNEPHSQNELLSAFETVHRESAELFRGLSQQELFRHPASGVWSPAENVIHLIKSVKAVASALRVPKVALTLRFGTSRRGSRTYPEVRSDYHQRLAKGGVATGPYVPATLEPADASEAARVRDRALAGWEGAGRDLVRGLGKWREAALDKYRMPHPLLGKLTVREMLFFTHFHDLHHVEVVRRHAAAALDDG